jgi:hypothetical protein
MKYFVALLTFVFATAQAADRHDLDFTAQPEHPIKTVQWVVMEDVSEVCQGFAPIKDKTYVACARFNKDICIVYTKPNLSLSVLGHEMRHCFEGQWHR